MWAVIIMRQDSGESDNVGLHEISPSQLHLHVWILSGICTQIHKLDAWHEDGTPHLSGMWGSDAIVVNVCQGTLLGTRCGVAGFHIFAARGGLFFPVEPRGGLVGSSQIALRRTSALRCAAFSM